MYFVVWLISLNPFPLIKLIHTHSVEKNMFNTMKNIINTITNVIIEKFWGTVKYIF